MNMTMADLKDALPVLSVLWLIGSAAVLWWLSKTFATKGQVEAIERRLGAGDNRFAGLEAMVRDALHAAEDAKEAAERATKAAEKVDDARLELARLGERMNTLTELLKRVEATAGHLTHGHMKMGVSA